MKKGILFFGGDFRTTPEIRKMTKGARIVGAANGGTEHALKLGIEPTFIVGDLDSISQATIRRLKKTAIYPYASDKDKSDSELALEQMLTFSPKELILLGATGTRLDHTMANISLLSTIPPTVRAKIVFDQGEIHFTKKRLLFKGEIGDLVSLIPQGDRGAQVKINGFYYELNHERLRFGSHGLSNHLTRVKAVIDVFRGAVFVFHYF